MFERIRRWLIWSWWELLLVVIAILMVCWFATGALARYVSMTVTDDGVVVSEKEPFTEMQDYWNGGRYYASSPRRLCHITVSGDAEAALRLPILPPQRVEVDAFSVENPDDILLLSLENADPHPVDYTRKGRTLTITPDFSTGDHQFIRVRAYWYNLDGKQEMHYVFMLSRSAAQ